MGVYIKDMEMPGNCRACRLKMNCEDCEGFECVCLPLHTQIGYLDDLLTGERRDDCPLVLVPPHGDLIDYDFCMQNYELLHDDDGNPVYAVRMREINSAPTVIQAEEESINVE